MTIQELWELTLNRAGMFLYSDQVELDIDKFKIFLERILEEYSVYKPRVEKVFINISNLRYTFSNPIPNDIIDVNPTYTTISLPIQIQNNGVPPVIEWQYRKPTLYTNFNGRAEVEAVYNWELLYDGTDYIVPIQDPLFNDYVLANFLIAIGRNRRAFTLSDLPVQTDSSSLVSEGLGLLVDTKRLLSDTSIPL